MNSTYFIADDTAQNKWSTYCKDIPHCTSLIQLQMQNTVTS